MPLLPPRQSNVKWQYQASTNIINSKLVQQVMLKYYKNIKGADSELQKPFTVIVYTSIILGYLLQGINSCSNWPKPGISNTFQMMQVGFHLHYSFSFHCSVS